MNPRSPLFAIALALASSSALAQSTWYVDLNGTAPGSGTLADPYTSIQYAAVQPSTISGDTLLVAPGEYLENVDLYSIGKPLEIKSLAGPEVTTIRSDAFSAVSLWWGSRLEGFTVRSMNGYGQTGIEICGSTVRRCVVTGFFTGLYACSDSSFLESTLTDNHLSIEISIFESLQFENSISWGNSLEPQDTNTLFVSYSLLPIVVPGPGNLHVDPTFWNQSFGDAHLKPGSVCIDAGNPASPLDPDGSRIDMGALTFDPNYAFGPTVYCVGKLNSQGCVPSIGSNGSCSATNPMPFLVTASGVVDNKVGLLFYGFGQRSQPFQGGLLCIQPPTKRCPGQSSGSNNLPPPGNFCSGTYAFDFNARIQSGAFPNLQAGEVIYAQWWSRDPQEPQGFGTGLTNAIAFGIAP